MQSKILILTPKKNTPGVDALVNASTKLGINLEVAVIDDDSTLDFLEGAAIVIYRFGPKSYVKFQNFCNKIQNLEMKKQLQDCLDTFDKCISYVKLKSMSISQPLSEVRTVAGEITDLPVVIKPPIGNQGNGVELIKTKDDFINLEREYFEKYGRLLIQAYIPESKGSDKRLIIVDDECVASMKRTASSGDFRANLHQGGSAVSYEPNTEEVKLAVGACSALGIRFAGVDIIDSQKGPLVLEVNPSPGFGISDIVGFDVAEAVIKKMYTV